MFACVDTATESERQWKISVAQRPAVSDCDLDLSSTKGENVLHFGAFGDKYFFIGDKTAKIDCWSCIPYITFVDLAHPAVFPRTDLPPTTSFIGAEAYVNDRKIVVANLCRRDGAQSAAVNVYIYNVESDFACAVQKVFTFSAAECCGSGFLGRLCSFDLSTHIVAFGDVSNNSHFTFGAVNGAVGSASAQSLEHVKPLKYNHVSDVFFKPDGTYYSASAHPVGGNAVALLVTANEDHYIVFERVVVLPFAYAAGPNRDLKCSVRDLKRVVTETGSIERLMVHVNIEQGRGGKSNGDGGSEENESAGTRAVAFLLTIPTNEVVCMSVLRGPHDLCALSADRQSIVQLQG
jgi:hypothetical protein